MSTAGPITDEPLWREPPDFSLVLGGPLFQFWRRARLTGETLQLLHRRIIGIVLLAWLPLLLLSVAEGHVWGRSIKLPFFLDLELHARLLLALPMLILAELVVHERIRGMVMSRCSAAQTFSRWRTWATASKLAPFTPQTVLQLAVVSLAPVGPLLLTMMPAEQLLERMLKIVF